MNDHVIPGVTKREMIRVGEGLDSQRDIGRWVGNLVILFLSEYGLQEHQEFNVVVFKGITYSDYTPYIVDVTPVGQA